MYDLHGYGQSKCKSEHYHKPVLTQHGLKRVKWYGPSRNCVGEQKSKEQLIIAINTFYLYLLCTYST